MIRVKIAADIVYYISKPIMKMGVQNFSCHLIGDSDLILLATFATMPYTSNTILCSGRIGSFAVHYYLCGIKCGEVLLGCGKYALFSFPENLVAVSYL